jgi:hypothetical protein
MRTLLIPIFLAGIFSAGSALFAAGSIGTSGADFLELGVSPRAAAMSEAATSLHNDIGAVYYNPAITGTLPYRQVFFSHQELIDDSRLEHISGIIPLKRGGIGLGNLYLAQTLFWVPPFDKIDEYGETQGEVNFYNSATAVGYGYGFGNFSLGITTKYIFQQIDELVTHSIAADIGAIGALTVYSPFRSPPDNLYLGISFLNLGTAAYDDPLPRRVRLGISYLPLEWMRVSTDFHESLIEADDIADFTYGFDESFSINTGLEMNYEKMIFFRAGYAFNDGTTFSFGGGFQYAIGRTAFSVDMGIAQTSYFGNVYSISFGVMLVPKVTSEDKKFAERFYMQGIRHYVSGDLENAIESLEKARGYNPYYKDIYKKLIEMKELKKIKEENDRFDYE